MSGPLTIRQTGKKRQAISLAIKLPLSKTMMPDHFTKFFYIKFDFDKICISEKIFTKCCS